MRKEDIRLVDLSHYESPPNASVFRHEGEVRIRDGHLPGLIWLFKKTEGGEAGYSEPLDQALLGFNGKHVRATVIIEEIEVP